MSKRARKHRHATQSIPPQGLTLATAALLGLLVTPGVALAENHGKNDSDPALGYIFRGRLKEGYAVVVEETLPDPRTIIGRYEGNTSDNPAEEGSATIGTAGGADVPDVQKQDIYGGYQGNDQAATSNTVTIYSGTDIKDVYGGYAAGNEATDNKVNILGSTSTRNIYGGMVEAANKLASGNTVIINGGTVGGTVETKTVYGGRNTNNTSANDTVVARGNAVVVNGTASTPVTINGNVYGNHAKSGKIDGDGKINVQLGPNVTVGESGSVYGGYLETGGGEATEHEVRIGGAHITGSVFGARHNSPTSGEGTVSKNSVIVNSGTVDKSIYGGFSKSGVADGNGVTIGAGDIKGDVYGGRGGTTVSNNTVEIAGGSFANKNIYAGYGASTASVVNNTISITGGATLDNTTLWGRRAVDNSAGNGSNNTLRVEVTGAGVRAAKNFDKYEFVLPANVQNNATLLTVTTALDTTRDSDGNALSGGDPVFTLDTAGPLDTLQLDDTLNLLVVDESKTLNLPDTIPNNATVALKDTTGAPILDLTKYTFSLDKGAVDGNEALQATLDTVNLYGYEDTGEETPGTVDRTKPWANQTLTIDSPREAEASNAYGGRAVVGGPAQDVSGNAVVVDKDNFPTGMDDFTLRENLYGGSTNKGNAENNTVELHTGTVKGSVYGGYTEADGSATGNTVTFSGDTVETAIYGGYANTGAATGNTAAVAGGTVNDVYGGYAATTGAATGNTVDYSGGTVRGTLYGGYSAGGDAVSGNTLIVQAKGLKAKAAKNFEKYTFALPSDLKAGETMLTLSEQGDSTISGANITVSGGGSLALNLNEMATLLSLGDDTLTVDPPLPAGEAKLDGANDGLIAFVYECTQATSSTLDITVNEAYQYGNGGTNTSGQRNRGNTLKLTGIEATAAFGGRATNGDVTNNTATMSGGTLKALNDPLNPNDALSGNLYGGYADAGNATGNAATLSGGTVEKAIYGGYANTGDATGNAAALSGGTVENVYGAWAEGKATDNTAAVTGGTVNQHVYGGYANTGDATGNTAAVAGGTVNQDVYGGYAATTGNATGNTVDYSGGTVRGTLYGGYSANGGDAVSGNTLLVRKSGLRAGNTANFERYWFVLPSNTVANATMLTLTDGKPTDLTNGGTSTPKVGVALLKGAGDPALRPGERVTLLHNAAGVKSDGFVDDSAALKQHVQGTFVDYDFELAADSNNLYASVTGAAANAKAKAPVEARMGMTALVNMGGELIAGRGMQAARTATRRKERAENPETYGLTGFATVEGNSSRYETGSHIDVSGVNTLLGLAKRFHSGDVDVLLGAFFEYGTGYVHTHNAGSIDGQGNNSYAGGGLLGRVEMNDATGGTTYGEASLRMGGTRSSWDSKDIVPGGTASYELNTPYYGAHAGLGYVWSPSERMSVETYGKYYWTHVDGDNVNIAGTRFKFKDVESHRVRAGVKADFKVNEQFGFYVGAAWEHEFNGKGEAVVSHLFDAPSPSLQGDIGVFDLGLNFTPAENFFISLGATGYVGKRQGIGGNLMFRYEF